MGAGGRELSQTISLAGHKNAGKKERTGRIKGEDGVNGGEGGRAGIVVRVITKKKTRGEKKSECEPKKGLGSAPGHKRRKGTVRKRSNNKGRGSKGVC